MKGLELSSIIWRRKPYKQAARKTEVCPIKGERQNEENIQRDNHMDFVFVNVCGACAKGEGRTDC
jgi:sulfur relay (sulfurtransferase) complex TusBCD TusD component (DsrE family)